MKPQRMEIQFASIPMDLIEKNQWIVWRWDQRDGKWTKPPYQISGAPAKSNDPSTWVSYLAVVEAYQNGQWDGIGFMLNGQHVGIDWDDIRDSESGKIDPEYLKKIRSVNSYTEISPSGNGVKTLVVGELPAKGHHNENVGVFSSGRYFCITGNVLGGCSLTIEPRQTELNTLVKHYWPNDFKKPELPTQNTRQEKLTSEIPQCDIIQKALDSKDDKFNRLWAGDFSEYASQSEADQALCCKLAFWTGNNYAVIDSLFRESALMRDKWDRADYRERTINNAIANTSEVYRVQEASEERAAIQAEAAEAEKKTVNPSEIFARYDVKKSYTDSLGKEEFLIDNLVIKNHILTVIGEAGAGKTTFFFFHAARHMTERGAIVTYIDADSPPSDHKMMQKYRIKYGFNWISPDGNEGTSIDGFKQDLVSITKLQGDLTNYVFIFDTLKKFVNLMGKDSTKKFYILARQMTKLGATIILLGHANKYRDMDGNLIPEGVGDVKSDSDDLIFFRHERSSDEGTNVTTMIDTEVGAKVRGIFKPFSFNINKYREVTFYKEAITPIDLVNIDPKAPDSDFLDVAAKYVSSLAEPISQNKLIEYAIAKVEGSIGINRARKLIIQSSVQKGDDMPLGTRFVYTVGVKNMHLYESPIVLKSSKKTVSDDIEV